MVPEALDTALTDIKAQGKVSTSPHTQHNVCRHHSL